MKAFLFTLLFILTLSSFAQTNKHSIGADINYLVPLMEATNNNFNYSETLLFGRKILPRLKDSAA